MLLWRACLPWQQWVGLALGPSSGCRVHTPSMVWMPSLTSSWQQLKQQRDKLKQYQRRITQQLEREREVARQLLREGKKE